MSMIKRIDNLDIEVAFYKGGIVGNTPEEKMLFNMRGVFAEYELTKIKERTSRGRRQRLKEGKFMGGASSNLYGYRYEDGQRHIVPDTGRIVKDIYNWFLLGDTLTESW
ncbi:recombinase family protein [Chloroflexota bacterium]